MKKKAMKARIKAIANKHCPHDPDIDNIANWSTEDLLWAIDEVMTAQTVVIQGIGHVKELDKPEKSDPEWKRTNRGA